MKKTVIISALIVLFTCSTIYASESIKATLFPVQHEINGQVQVLPDEYSVINLNGHAYVPVRYISESIGLGIKYDEKNQMISIASEPQDDDELSSFLWKVQFKLNYNMTQNDLMNLLKRKPQILEKNKDGSEEWRFDVGTKSSYNYNNTNIGDEAGLLEGKIASQLFLVWDVNGELKKINLWYTKINGLKQVQVHVFNAYPNGTTTDSIYE